MAKVPIIQDYNRPGQTIANPNYGKDIQATSANDTRVPFAGTPVGPSRAATANANKNFIANGRGTGLGTGAPGMFDSLGGLAGFTGGPGTTQKITGPFQRTGLTAPAGGDSTGGSGTPGSESGPGILEQWFNQRANGIDQGYQYALDRGTQNINNEAAARGGYNSGATMRQIGDFSANLGSQRQAQLDALAGGASGERQRRLEDMFGEGLGLANGASGVGTQYDIANGTGQSTLNSAILQLLLNKGGVDSKNSQAVIQNLLAGLALL